jgi:methionyl aminopeptidase
MVPGASVREVCEAVEDEIRRRGGGLAFPAQSSRNDVAAHDCPAPDDRALYASGDLAKLDIGVHVDGWVVDTATTVSVGDAPEGRAFIEAAQAALAAGIAAVYVGGSVRAVSIAIDRTIRAAGLRPMRNLCGHGVGRWTVHGPPPVPNELLVSEPDAALPQGTLIAVEPFVTDGAGRIRECGPAEVFLLKPGCNAGGAVDGEVLSAMESLNGLPFARRQLAALPGDKVEGTLAALLKRGCLRGYPPLAESSGRPVAQAEHTLHVGSDGVEVLTR